MKIIYQEQSQRAKSAEALITVFVVALLGAIAYTTYQNITKQVFLLSEYFIEIVALIVILKQAVGRYTYILTEDKLIIEEKSFFRNRHFEVDYNMIDGVYEFRQELVSNFKFRYKYRKCSTADTRKVWALVYTIANGTKVQNARVLLKGEDTFFDILNTYVPNRIRVPQSDVVFYAAVRVDAIKHGENVDDYYASIMAGAEKNASKKEPNT